MDAGKVKTVLGALRDELHSRSTASPHGSAGAAEDGTVLPAYANDGLGHDGERRGSESRKHREAAESGVVVDLSSDAVVSDKALDAQAEIDDTDTPGPAELTQRPIPELVVPFFVPQEPLVAIGPYLVRAVLAAAAAGIVIVFVL